MKVIIEDLAKRCLDDILYHNMQYSAKNAIETDIDIFKHFYFLEYSPYIGKYVPKIPDKHFRELLYKKSKNTYRIIYYISESINTVHIVHVSNCKQDFNHILKLHNYFNNYFNF